MRSFFMYRPQGPVDEGLERSLAYFVAFLVVFGAALVDVLVARPPVIDSEAVACLQKSKVEGATRFGETDSTFLP